jgi:hypothetical protein
MSSSLVTEARFHIEAAVQWLLDEADRTMADDVHPAVQLYKQADRLLDAVRAYEVLNAWHPAPKVKP